MPGKFDTQGAVERLLSAEMVLEKADLNMRNSPLEVDQGTLVIHGDGTQGGLVRGAGSVLVEGHLKGHPKRPCRIKVEGDVVVMGNVQHADISARHIQIGGCVSHAQLEGRWGLKVGESVSEAELEVGTFEPEKREIERSKIEVEYLRGEREKTAQRLSAEQRRLDKLFRTSRFSLPIVGQIVHMDMDKKRVVVDLSHFYSIVGKKDEEEIDRALQQFFSKAVVGLLMRYNQAFLSAGKNRHEIFSNVIQSLHDLFMVTRELDKYTARIEVQEVLVEDLIRALKGDRGKICVKGEMSPEITVRVTVPDVGWAGPREPVIERMSAYLVLGLEGMYRVDVFGDEEALEFQAQTLEACAFCLEEGQVCWQPLESEEQVGAA